MKKFTRILAVMLALVLVLGSIPAEAASGSTTVATQSALNEALTSGKYTKITIKTSDKATFKIGEGKYSKIALYVSGSKATVENNAVFKSITINDASVYTEKAVGNTIKVADKKVTLNVAKGAKVTTLSLAKKNATDSVNVEGEIGTLKLSSKTNLSLVNNGTISKLYTYKGGEVNISGTPSSKTAVTVKEKSAGIKITSVTPIKVTLSGSADIVLDAGAEGTSVKTKSDAVVVSLINGSKKKVTITEADGSKTSVGAGKSATVGGEGSASTPTPAPTATPTPSPEPTATPTPTPEPTATPTPVPKLTVSQKATNVIALTGDGISSSITKDDVKIYTMSSIGVELDWPVGIKDVSYADGTATVTMYSGFSANIVYYVRVGGTNGTLTSFTGVSDTLADVYKIVLTTSSATVGEEATLAFKYYNKNDVDLTDSILADKETPIFVVNDDYEYPGSLVVKVSKSPDSTWINGDKITFENDGVALLDITLVTAYDAEFKPITVKATGTIVASKPKVGDVLYTITKDDGTYFTIKEKSNAKHTLEMNDNEYNVFEALISIGGSYKSIKDLGYTLKAANENILVVTPDTTYSGGSKLVGTGIGKTDLIIYDGDTVVATVKDIQVRAERKPASITLTKNKSFLNTNPLVADSIIIAAVVKDQYGDTIDNPSLTVEQVDATRKMTGTVSLGSFTGGKLLINGSDVTIDGTPGKIAITVACADSPDKKATESFSVKDIAYSATETYTTTATVEGSRVLDTGLSIGVQDDESTFVYIAYTKEGYYVDEKAGKPLSAAPTTKLTATELGVPSGTTGLYYTILHGNTYIGASTANIKMDTNNIEFKPITTGSKLDKGTYKIQFYSITAGDSSSTFKKVGNEVVITVSDTNPEFSFVKIKEKASASGSWADILPVFFDFYWNGEKVPAYSIIDAETIKSTSGSTTVTSVTFQFDNSLYGSFTVKQILGDGDKRIYIE